MVVGIFFGVFGWKIALVYFIVTLVMAILGGAIIGNTRLNHEVKEVMIAGSPCGCSTPAPEPVCGCSASPAPILYAAESGRALPTQSPVERCCPVPEPVQTSGCWGVIPHCLISHMRPSGDVPNPDLSGACRLPGRCSRRSRHTYSSVPRSVGYEPHLFLILSSRRMLETQIFSPFPLLQR